MHCDLAVHDGLNTLPHTLFIPGVWKVATNLLSICVLFRFDTRRDRLDLPSPAMSPDLKATSQALGKGGFSAMNHGFWSALTGMFSMTVASNRWCELFQDSGTGICSGFFEDRTVWYNQCSPVLLGWHHLAIFLHESFRILEIRIEQPRWGWSILVQRLYTSCPMYCCLWLQIWYFGNI